MNLINHDKNLRLFLLKLRQSDFSGFFFHWLCSFFGRYQQRGVAIRYFSQMDWHNYQCICQSWLYKSAPHHSTSKKKKSVWSGVKIKYCFPLLGSSKTVFFKLLCNKSATQATLTFHVPLTLRWVVAIYWSLNNKAALSSKIWLTLHYFFISCIID